MESERKLVIVDADRLSEEEKARQLRLLALRERVMNAPSGDGAAEPAAAPARRAHGGADAAAAVGETAASPGAGAAAGADEGGELNAFLKELVEKRRARHHQLQIIQDFFENPVEFGVEVDYIPSGTPLSEIKTRKKELRYRIRLLSSVLEAFQGELAMLEQAERSALSPAEEGEEAETAARTREDLRPSFEAGEGGGQKGS